jgi:YfiH family protein
MTAEFLTFPLLQARHGFFTRRGGVSQGPYASLNCSLSGGDDPVMVAQNRSLVAASMGVAADRLVGLTQVHGADVVTVHTAWPAGAGARADAMVTAVPGIALGVITADCAPVLFVDARAGVVGAAHAGWRGAAAGVLEATVTAMEALGAARAQTVAVVGPCIAQASYEVGEDMRAQLDAADAFFAPGKRPGHWQFDLGGYCVRRLQAARVVADRLAADTCADEARFFSHRRRTLAGGGAIGHQISCVVI